jgi:Outer membrane protein beta-barrel domain
MKKILLLIFATSSIVFVRAQVQFGVKAGYNLTTLTGSRTTGFDSKSGFSGGVLAAVPLFNSFYLQPEIVYSGQGSSFTDGSQKINLNYDYLNVPVLFKYQNPNGLFAETGPQVGFLLSAKGKQNGITEDIKDFTQSVDFSWAFGLGYKIPNINLGIDIRYNLGLTNTAKDLGDETAKNSVFQFGLFYMFGGE